MKKDRMTEQNITELLEQMTLEEKTGMIHGCGLFCTRGVERLGIPPLTMSDGPMGVRNDFENDAWRVIGHTDDYVTYLPSNSAIASSWNRETAYEMGRVLGEEARGRGKDVILAPGINIKRSPLCGRNFEYMSEDPLLTGDLAVPLIRGIQEQDTAACVKHFALNNQETERLWVDVEVEDRALHEIYLPAFKKAVKEGETWSLMGAYNLWHGKHCCENTELLNGILRTDWAYDGTVISDWGAVHHTEQAAKSGLDVEMSVTDNFDQYCLADPLIEAVKAGEIPEEQIDEKIRNILRMMFRIRKLGTEKRKAGSYNTPEHQKAVLEAARESVILLKNENALLPLDREKMKKILVVGENADRIHSSGGGSAEIKALYEITPLLGLHMLLGGNVQVDYVRGYVADDMEETEAEINWQADSLNPSSEASAKETAGQTAEKTAEGIRARQDRMRREAVEKAAEYDTVIFVGGQNHNQDLEGRDRQDMHLPYRQDELISELLTVRPDTVIVLISGSPVEMPWADRAKALVWQYYSGMQGGTALAEVLFGEINPSGRLAETFPVKIEDCPAHCIGEFPGAEKVRYQEGLMVGYRYYTTKQVPVLFPFGHGLSYTEFSVHGLCAVTEENGGFCRVRVTAEVTNTGNRAGKEIVQIYAGKKDGPADRPVRELKAFEKILLEPGETKTVEFLLEKEAFGCYDEEKSGWFTSTGVYEIVAGKSADDLWEKTECTIG